MISYAQALEVLAAAAPPPSTISCTLQDSLGHVAAQDILSPIQVPSFANSAMDGFAVRRSGLAGASSASPVTLPIHGAVHAGDSPASAPDTGVVRIMTGAPVPDGFDAVVPVEEVQVQRETAVFSRCPAAGAHIRRAGEDIQLQQVLVHGGDVITPARLMLLAAAGQARICVRRAPALHLLPTGPELVDASLSPLPARKIYNSTSPYLLARARQWGVEATLHPVIPDDADMFEQRLRSLPAGALIVSTGAVSKGDRDFIPGSLERLGAQIRFHRVNIRPGKPILFATLPNGAFFFGLPGNPISAAVGFDVFVRPFLNLMFLRPLAAPVMARLSTPFTKTGPFRQFLKARLWIDDHCILQAQILDGQESFKISSLAEANGWVVLDETQTGLPAGTHVPILPFEETSCPML